MLQTHRVEVEEHAGELLWILESSYDTAVLLCSLSDADRVRECVCVG